MHKTSVFSLLDTSTGRWISQGFMAVLDTQTNVVRLYSNIRKLHLREDLCDLNIMGAIGSVPKERYKVRPIKRGWVFYTFEIYDMMRDEKTECEFSKEFGDVLAKHHAVESFD